MDYEWQNQNSDIINQKVVEPLDVDKPLLLYAAVGWMVFNLRWGGSSTPTYDFALRVDIGEYDICPFFQGLLIKN